MGVALALLVLVGGVSLCVGNYALTPSQMLQALGTLQSPQGVVVTMRVVRLLAVVLVGASLSMAGATYQAVFANGLASPNVLGVATGASVGAAFAILCGWPLWAIEVAAFGSGLATVTLTLALSRLLPQGQTLTLVLAGMIAGGLATSCLGVIKYVADPEDQLQSIVFWELGSFAKVDATTLFVIAPVLLVAGGFLIAARWRLNALTLDDDAVRALGLSPRANRTAMVVAATLLTAASVCLCGEIGWIGLIVPHLARSLVGSDNRRVLPLTAVVGAALLAVADTFARSVSVNDIPLSIITGFIGVPVLIVILVRRQPLGL
jgi:iron complex transport system permease protein